MDDSYESVDIFQEPEGFYKEHNQEPTFVEYETLDGKKLHLRLVGHSPLWGHFLWNAGRTIAAYLESHASTFLHDKTVLELGAGAGLPSLISALYGARFTLVTDYPDPDLVENLRWNVTACEKLLSEDRKGALVAEGYLWGAETAILTKHLPTEQPTEGATETPSGERTFDLLILADLLFNHSEHGKLIASMQQTLRRSRDAVALVFFTPYRPWLLSKDLAFFDLAREAGFAVEKIMEKTMDRVMFEEDPGDELLRRTVFGYRLQWADQM